MSKLNVTPGPWSDGRRSMTTHAERRAMLHAVLRGADTGLRIAALAVLLWAVRYVFTPLIDAQVRAERAAMNEQREEWE